MTRGKRFPPTDDTAVTPASRATSVSGKRPEAVSGTRAVIFRFADAVGMWDIPPFPAPSGKKHRPRHPLRNPHPLTFGIQST